VARSRVAASCGPAQTRGYAGDFEMLQQICSPMCAIIRWVPPSTVSFKPKPLRKPLRSRTDLIAAAIADVVRERDPGPVHVLSVGSGPAIDIQRACGLLKPAERQRLRITLLDLDPPRWTTPGHNWPR